LLTQPTLHQSCGYSVPREPTYMKLRASRILLHSAKVLVLEQKETVSEEHHVSV
jgi:hypothetical protein